MREPLDCSALARAHCSAGPRATDGPHVPCPRGYDVRRKGRWRVLRSEDEQQKHSEGRHRRANKKGKNEETR